MIMDKTSDAKMLIAGWSGRERTRCDITKLQMQSAVGHEAFRNESRWPSTSVTSRRLSLNVGECGRMSFFGVGVDVALM